jgi:hypothetical protein
MFFPSCSTWSQLTYNLCPLSSETGSISRLSKRLAIPGKVVAKVFFFLQTQVSELYGQGMYSVIKLLSAPFYCGTVQMTVRETKDTGNAETALVSQESTPTYWPKRQVYKWVPLSTMNVTQFPRQLGSHFSQQITYSNACSS